MIIQCSKCKTSFNVDRNTISKKREFFSEAYVKMRQSNLVKHYIALMMRRSKKIWKQSEQRLRK